MPKIVIESNVLVPEYKKTLDYYGPHPSRILKELPELLQTIYKIKNKDVFEDDFRWDVSGDPISFYMEMRAQDAKDSKSKIWVGFRISGEQSAKDMVGKLKILMQSNLRTEIEYNNSTDRMLHWMYNRIFYEQQRLRYLEESRVRLERLADEIRSLFNIMKREE